MSHQSKTANNTAIINTIGSNIVIATAYNYVVARVSPKNARYARIRACAAGEAAQKGNDKQTIYAIIALRGLLPTKEQEGFDACLNAIA